MGERAAYVVRSDGEYTPYLRKQWYVGQSKEVMEAMCKKIATGLITKYDGDVTRDVGDGLGALRDDLNDCPGRAFHAMVKGIGSLPFDEIREDVPLDIADQGIWVIDVTEPYKWTVSNIPVIWKDGEERVMWDKEILRAYVEFKKGKPMPKAMNFYVPNEVTEE